MYTLDFFNYRIKELKQCKQCPSVKHSIWINEQLLKSLINTDNIGVVDSIHPAEQLEHLIDLEMNKIVWPEGLDKYIRILRAREKRREIKAKLLDEIKKRKEN